MHIVNPLKFHIRLPKPPLLGLDINTDAIKLVELSMSGGNIRVEHADSEALPSGAMNERDILNAESISQTVRTILKRSGIRTKSVATALPANAAIVKVISLPETLDSLGIEEQITFDGGQYIPYSMDAVHFDFVVLGPDANRKGLTPGTGYNHVLLVACKKEAVEERVAVLEESGLKPKIVDVKPFALWSLQKHLARVSPLPHNSDKAVILVEIGSLITNVYVFQEGNMVYSREHPFGFGRLTDEIQRRYSLTAQDAQRMERFGGLPSNYDQEVLEPFTKNMAQEIFRALDFFQASMPDIPTGSVHLFGVAIRVPQLMEQLGKLLNLPVFIPDPFAGMSLASKVNRRFMDAERSSLAVACGLALRRLPA